MPPVDRSPGWKIGAGVAALLVLHFTLALWAASRESVTADEILHITGGYFYDKFGDYRIQPENGNLPQRWAALPAALLDAPPPKLEDNPYWRASDASVMGHQFFYETGHDHWPMLMAGRAMIALFSVGTGLLVFCWARRLFGLPGGFLALSFYAFDPNLLAHAALATSDAAAVFFLLATAGAFWRHLQEPDWRTGALSALVFGLACVAKYSAVLLLPMMVLLLGWRLALAPADERKRWAKIIPLTLTAHGIAAIFIIWLFFGFRYSGFSPGLPGADHYIVSWEGVLPYLGWQGRVVQFCRDWHLLPEAFLYGYAWVIQSAQARGAFLAGEYGIYGWVSFFPLAFLWKTPLAVLLALGLTLLSVGRRWAKAAGLITADLTLAAPLLVLFAVYGSFSLTSHLNIGHRHILPIYTGLLILTGGLAAGGITGWRRGLVGALLGGQLFANALVAPHYLAFFNALAGGPANGWRLLVDSSLDWGQDLPGLKSWLDQQTQATGSRPRPLFISYFGSGDPGYYGIAATRLPFVNGFKEMHPWYEPTGGWYAVSATMLQQVYSPVRGAWTAEWEKEYQEARLKAPLFREYWRNEATRRAVRATGTGAAFERTWQRFDSLRFARLCHYLRARRPDAVVGYSIFIYHLSQAEVDAALNGSYSTWLQAQTEAAANN